MNGNESKIIPAIDKMSLRRALNLVAAIGPSVPAYKVHAVAELNIAFVVKQFYKEGATGVWLDFKDNDMPDTVTERAAEAKDAGVTMLTVHAGGGPKMVEAAVKNGPPFIIAVTLLTSITDEMALELYNPDGLEESLRQDRLAVVIKLARWAKQGGAHALVCSAKEVGALSAMEEFSGMKKIVPGTRSTGVAHHDQKQVDTPYNAIKNGAYYLVGGRQITQATDPIEALKAMDAEVQSAIMDDTPTVTA